MERYEPSVIEPKWQKRWDEARAFAVPEPTGDPFYLLVMLPYPSGRIHMGHVRNYALGDVFARQLRMAGKTVLHPMGWDAFGMPAENAAIANKRHPRDWTDENIAQMKRQLKRLGLSYDWDREIKTCDPSYYKHEQEMFLKMLEKGIAYRKHALANWCESCQTVLANEQVEDGKCWRCGHDVTQREMEQWFLRTTQYAAELLDGIRSLEGKWPDKIVKRQVHHFGRSEGAEIHFPLDEPVDNGREREIVVFTTRPDTLFGVTFMSIAAEHPLALKLAQGTDREKEVAEFIQRIRMEHKVSRGAADTAKEGVFTGRWAIHPFTGAKIPIWIANFVLMDYGTGAVMAVPAHDQRDFEFAKKHGLPIRVVIRPADGPPADPSTMTAAFSEPGVMVNGGSFDGTANMDGIAAVSAELKKTGKGGPAVSYRLRDWLVSRQRYWGAPIPVVHCGACGVVPVPRAELPVELPMDVEIRGAGGSPLERHPTFSKRPCPKCGGDARRETDTFDTFIESSWYLHRYTTPRYEQGPVEPTAARAWLPIDLYIGGEEHAVGHLVYCRFWHKAMIDLGYLPPDTPREPATELLAQGMVCHEIYFRTDPQNPAHKSYFYPEETELRDGKRVLKKDGKPVRVGPVIKMSKSKQNLVDPDDIVRRYGADTARLFVLFAAPPEGQVDWNEAGVEGMSRFLLRVFRLVRDHRAALVDTAPYTGGPLDDRALELRRRTHRTIAKVTHDVAERRQPNTAIAAMMELVNALVGYDAGTDARRRAVLRESVDCLLKLLSPFAPHLCDELFEQLGGKGLLLAAPWPGVDQTAIEEATVEIPIQINGKVRGRVVVPREATEQVVLEAARREENVAAHLEGRSVSKTLYRPGKILTLVVS